MTRESRKLVDPVLDGIINELRVFRRAPGTPEIERLSGLSGLIDALGYGDVARAWTRMQRLYDEHGVEPTSDIGAYFYLSGWNVGRETLDQRITLYKNTFNCVDRTALRRGDRGMSKLAMIIRDSAEESRPWGMITLFQSGAKADVIIRLVMGYESWRPAVVRVNDEDISDPKFTLHRSEDVAGGYFHQLIAENVPLALNVVKGGRMASVLVAWPMPVWPTWQTAAYVADPRIIVRTRTYVDRGVEIRLEWRSNAEPNKTGSLLSDKRAWVDDYRGQTDDHVNSNTDKPDNSAESYLPGQL